MNVLAGTVTLQRKEMGLGVEESWCGLNHNGFHLIERAELTYSALGKVHPVPLLKTQHVDI